MFVLDIRIEEIEETLLCPRLLQKEGRGLRVNIGMALLRPGKGADKSWGRHKSYNTADILRNTDYD
jgi:hypothetical protein